MDSDTLAERIEQAAELIRTRQPAVAFTGAGISVESGIPAFRGPGGLWETVDPIFIDLQFFHANPLESWEKIRDIFYSFFGKASANAGHQFLARLEKHGMLHGVITQNIDNLHQEAGNQHVVEFHGNSNFLVCTGCADRTAFSEDIFLSMPPRCTLCDAVLKPDFIFYGETIPMDALAESERLAQHCGLMIVVGTTGEVYPASQLPAIARSCGAKVIEINPGQTVITPYTDIYLPLKATEAGDRIWAALAPVTGAS